MTSQSPKAQSKQLPGDSAFIKGQSSVGRCATRRIDLASVGAVERAADDIFLIPKFDLAGAEDRLFGELKKTINWRQEQITLFGKTMNQPRLTAWHGDDGTSYRYSGTRLSPQPWTEALSGVKASIENALGQKFNSVLLNLYRDQHDSMGMHSDDEPELGPTPLIASLSLGAERVFQLKHRHKSDQPRLNLTLGSGSLLIMQGWSQRDWKHGIRKERRACGPRMNLTFRWTGAD